MSLRLRLALAVALTAIPVVAGAVWIRRDLDERAYVDFVSGVVYERMYQNGREACEALPERFPFPPRRWGRRGRSRPDRDGRDGRDNRPDRDAPGAPDAEEGRGDGPPRHRRPRPTRPTRRDRRRRPPVFYVAYGPDFVSRNPRAPEFPPELRRKLEDGAKVAIEGRWVGLRMNWSEGPCCIVLARRAGDEPVSRAGDLVGTGALICGALLLAVLLAAAPIVRRIRRLERDVRAAAAEGWDASVPVEGRDEIAGLARAFNDAGEEIRAHVDSVEAREATLRRFLANTTHDVMTPLTVLQGHLAALPEEERVAAARHEADYMASLLHNLSAAAKLEAGGGRIQRDPVDLGELVARVAARHRPVAEKRGVQVEYALPGDVAVASGDVTLLEQAVGNVVHNAVRYNRPGGRVAIVLAAREGRFSLKVMDDGPGVPEDELARLGERSYRGDAARTRQPAGQGLGLSIAREVAARHGFALTLARNDDGGLDVELSGPLAREGEVTRP